MLVRIRNLASLLGVLGVSSLIALPAYSQISPINGGNTRLNRTPFNDPIIRINPPAQNLSGTSSSYPYGSRVNELGWISTPGGQVIYPSVGSPNGNGTTTYHYPNGAQITINKNKLPASGGFLR